MFSRFFLIRIIPFVFLVGGGGGGERLFFFSNRLNEFILKTEGTHLFL